MAHEDLMTSRQVADWLHVSIRFVSEHASELGGVRMGGSVRKAGHLRFRETKIQEWIEGGGSSPKPMRRQNETSPRPEPKRIAS